MILALIKAALEAIADNLNLYSHTSELQSGGLFADENVTPELWATKYAGVNVTNTPVEREFGL